MPTIRFEQEGQQVGCIEGANLRKAALDAGINPYKGLNNFNNCGGLGQCGTCVMEVVEGMQNLSPAPMWRRCTWLIDPPTIASAAAPASMGMSPSAPVLMRLLARAPTVCWGL